MADRSAMSATRLLERAQHLSQIRSALKAEAPARGRAAARPRAA
ncbi:MAG: hypothetical protein ACJA1L_001348 [Paracoccaceae bacterium]|jgi:hypothetical protein